MSDKQSQTKTVPLSDLNVARVRDENDHVDERMSTLEAQVESLQEERADLQAQVEELEEETDRLEESKEKALEDQKDEYESELAELREEIETKDELIAEIRENRREELLDELREAKAQATGMDPEEVDVSAFEEAEEETIQSTIDTLEEVVGNTNRVDVSSNQENLGGGDYDEDDKRRVAREMGVADMLDEAEDLAPQGISTSGDQA